MRVFIVLICTLGVAPWFTACSTAPANSGGASTSQSNSTRTDRDNALRKLQKGMTADQVRAAWGEPKAIAPMEAPTGHAEVWTYTFSFAGPVREVQSGEITYTRQNPLTGQEETLKEPVYTTEHTTVEQTVDLLFYDGRLTEWKQSHESTRQYN